MHFQPEQIRILRAALALSRRVIVEGETTPSAAVVGDLQQQAGLQHVHGWFPPQLDGKALAAHKTNMLRLESLVRHEEQISKRGIKQWLHRGELPDDVNDVNAALEVAANLMDKASVADILGLPMFLGDDGLFYVLDLRTEIVLCNPAFVEDQIADFVAEMQEQELDAHPQNPARLQDEIDDLHVCVKRHRETVERMYGGGEIPSLASTGDLP